MIRYKPRELILVVGLTAWYFVLHWAFGRGTVQVVQRDSPEPLKYAVATTPIQQTVATELPEPAGLPKQAAPLAAVVPPQQQQQQQQPVVPSSIANNAAATAGWRKSLVVASIKNMSTSWVATDLPDWEAYIYVADDPTASLHPEKNKGNEANVYLKWIIDNYDNLPDVAVFVHGHRNAYHSDFAFRNTPETVRRLKLDYVKKVGYQTLTCWEAPGCNVTVQSFWNYAMHFKYSTDLWKVAFNEEPPELVICPKFAQFAVSRGAIQYRSKADYERIRNWILETTHRDWLVGRWMEHMWHHIFGKNAAFCQLRQDCLSAFDMSDKTPAEIYKAIQAYHDAGWDKIG